MPITYSNAERNNNKIKTLGNQFCYKRDLIGDINRNINFSGFMGFYRRKVSKTYLPYKHRPPFRPRDTYSTERPVQFV
jgi:hypothetical protein